MASNLRDVPRKCVIAGIPNGPFSIYNSNNYKFTYAKIQLIIPSESNAPRILNSSGRYIMEACDKMIQKNCFPIKCTIVKNEAGRYYYFK